MSAAGHATAIRRAGELGDAAWAVAAARRYALATHAEVLRLLLASAWRRAVALGPLLPIAAMAVGLAVQGLAALAFQALPVILVVTLVCGLLGMGVPALGRALGATVLAVTVSLGVVAPLIGWVLAGSMGAAPEARAWVALASAAPVGSAALGAALAIGMPGVTTAGAVIATLLAAPVVLPAMAFLLGAESGIAPGPLALRVALLAGLPVLLALALRRVPRLAAAPARRRSAEVALIALGALALARMHGVRETVAADPEAALALCGLALVPTVAGALAVWLVLRGRAGAEAVLAGGFRNVALVWAAAAHALPPEGNLFMALTAIPIFAMPALARLAMRHRRPALTTTGPA